MSVYIGNDIVDLSEESIRDFNPRFPDRILSESEKAYLETNSQNFEYLLWKAWSAKEAAYKYQKQKVAETHFSPRMFSLNFENSIVSYLDQEIPVSFHEKDDYIFCVTQTQSRTRNKVACMQPSENQSEKVRLLAEELIQQEYLKSNIKINFSKDNIGAPIAMTNGRPLPLAISFTHHGKYAAVSFIRAC